MLILYNFIDILYFLLRGVNRFSKCVVRILKNERIIYKIKEGSICRILRNNLHYDL